jgi:hypothetical protein
MADIKLMRWTQILNRVVNLDAILYGSDGFEYYLDYILFNSVASNIPKWWTFKRVRWSQLSNRLMNSDEIFYASDGINHYLC